MESQLDIERALLGAVLQNPDTLIDVVEIVRADHFVHEMNKGVFWSVLRLWETNRAVDLVTVSETVPPSGSGPEHKNYCYQLYAGVGVVGENAVYYASILLERYKWRKLTEVADEVFTVATAQEMSADDALDYAEGKIFEIAADGGSDTEHHIGDLIKPALDQFEAARAADGGITGLESGFYDLDKITSGWHKTDLTIIAARPAMGKSAFAMQVALNAARAGIPTVFFSLEMGGVQLAQRIITGEAGVNPQRARTGFTNDEDWTRMATASGRIADVPLYIDDGFNLSPIALRAKCRRAKSRRGLGLVVVDYLQLMSVPDMRRGANREQEISKISRSLKGLAKELDIPVLALSQLSRAVESRGAGARPQLSDLRESGAIEQDADNVLFIHRPEMYGVTMDNDTGRSLEGIGEVIVSKQRSGPLGKVELLFREGRFSNLQKTNHGGGQWDF